MREKDRKIIKKKWQVFQTKTLIWEAARCQQLHPNYNGSGQKLVYWFKEKKNTSRKGNGTKMRNKCLKYAILFAHEAIF